MVLVLHGAAMTEGLEKHPWLVDLTNRLGAGVQLFFVLSGFVITAAMDRAASFGDGSSGFLLRRLAKLGPLYLIFLHLNIAFFWLWSAHDPDPHFFRNSVTGDNLNVENYGLHLLFLQGLSPAYINTLLDGGWSIVCEVYFYALAPFVFHPLCRSLRRAIWALAVSILVAIGFTMAVGKHMGAFGYYAFPVQLPCFVMGILVYRARERFTIDLPSELQAPIAVTIALFVFGFLRTNVSPLGGHVMIAILFALALLVLRVHTGRGLLGALQAIGRQSYALFLVHLFLLKIAYTTVFANGFYPGLWLALCLNLAISVLGALALSWLIFDRIDRFFVTAMARYLSSRRKAQ